MKDIQCIISSHFIICLRPGAGGGVDDEMIEVIEMPLKDAWKLVEQGSVHTSPPSFLFGVLWFLTNRAPKV